MTDLTYSGFTHEGVRRRAVFSTSQSSWKDIVYFALLNTEWIVRRFIRPVPKNLWDEMN